MKHRLLTAAGVLFFLAVACVLPAWTQDGRPSTDNGLPAKFDLRTLGAVTPIKQQQGGTCW